MVYLDTNIIVYLLEGVPDYAQVVSQQLTAFKKRGFRFYGSTLLISEFTAGTSGTINDLRAISGLSFVSVSESIAVRSGILQRSHAIRIGDSIHLATAIEMGCEIFFTNDKKLASIAKNYLSVTLLSDCVQV